MIASVCQPWAGGQRSQTCRTNNRLHRPVGGTSKGKNVQTPVKERIVEWTENTKSQDTRSTRSWADEVDQQDVRKSGTKSAGST